MESGPRRPNSTTCSATEVKGAYSRRTGQAASGGNEFDDGRYTAPLPKKGFRGHNCIGGARPGETRRTRNRSIPRACHKERGEGGRKPVAGGESGREEFPGCLRGQA